MATIIHIQTTVQTVLGILDDEGNVTEQVSLTGQPQSLSDEAFASVAEQVRAKRDELAAGDGAA